MARKKNNNPGELAIDDYRHKDAKRKNIPPAKIAAEGIVPAVPKIQYSYTPRRSPELRFDPNAGPDKLPTILAKARQGPLNDHDIKALTEALRTQEPWLEWAGKLEQNRCGLEVDPVALHIHERVSAQAILKIAARQDVQRDLFGDPQQSYAQSVQFYKHEIGWTNRMILGDSLQVMASLAQREDLAGKVQMIYLDPPYGIKFASNFQPEIGKRDVKDKESDLTREPEMVKAYRDTWTLGVHSYLAYLRDRLWLCKELLADSGSIFVQIGDENLHLVRSLIEEVFGKDNFVVTIIVKKKSVTTVTEAINDYLLWFAKDRTRMLARQLTEDKDVNSEKNRFSKVEFPNGERREIEQCAEEVLKQVLVRFLTDDYPMVSQDPSPTRSGTFEMEGRPLVPGANRHWTHSPEVGMRRLEKANRLRAAKNTARGVVYLDDFMRSPIQNVWEFHGERDPVYVVQTNRGIVERCLLMTTDPGDLVLDATCGSGTTAFVAEQWGRRWITIDTSRVALALARQRLLTSKFEYYKLCSVGAEDLKRNPSGQWLTDPNDETRAKATFACKSVPHITLKSIAQNTNLDPIFAKHEPLLDKALAACDAALAKVTDEDRAKLLSKITVKQREEGKKAVTDADLRRWQLPKKGEQWQHWQGPFDTDADWPNELQQAATAYRAAWRAKMDEVNACISANAEQEKLVDKPEIKRGIVRVSGPFSVEAVQPPEISLVDQPEFGGAPESLPDAFESDIQSAERQNIEAYIDQMTKLLRFDGVRFPDNKQMKFSRLSRVTGTGGSIHAEGRWVAPGERDDDAEGKATVAVAFGPQYGPVTAKQVEELIRATNRRGYDNLVIAGFSFDGPAQATVAEASHPNLRVHIAHIRPDVNPGMDGLLKETPNSQLFSVFGQPRTSVSGPDKENNHIVEMLGVDIYDPVTNAILSTGAQKVAAWFLDGDYDGRTFCITQAFFPDKTAWEKLSKALSGVIDPNRFEALSGTTALPFPAGPNRCVAVKVIDPRGNEVMAVHKLA